MAFLDWLCLNPWHLFGFWFSAMMLWAIVIATISVYKEGFLSGKD